MIRYVLTLSLGLAAGVYAQPRNITNQLVVHLTFDNTLNDTSGRGNHATYDSHNGLVTKPAAPTYVAGKIGSAFQFTTALDASKIDFASLGYPADLKFGATSDWSVAFWIFNTNNVGDPAIIANKNWYASANPGWGVFAQNGGNFRVQMTDSQNTSLRVAGTRAEIIRNGTWHHIVVTLKIGETRKIYFDGALVDSVANTITGGIDTDNLLNGEGQPYAVNIGEDATGAYNNTSPNPPPALATGGNSAIINAAIDDLGVWRRVLSGVEVAAVYNFGQKGTNLFNVPDATAPVVLSFTPNNGASAIAPNIATSATILDQATQVNTNSIQLFVDGLLVSHKLSKSGATNIVTYAQPFLSAPLTTHTNMLVFADNGAPTRSTNVNVFTIAAWTNIYLPPPLYFENFESITLATNPPAIYPTGWTVANCSDCGTLACDLGWNLFNERSDAYYDWQITSMDIIASRFNYGSRIQNVNGSIVVNGKALSTLGSNNIAFAASDQRAGSQIQMMFTRDYDLTGQSNVWVAFNSMYSQENDQVASLEYSIDQGTNWLPILYMPATSRVILGTNGIIDAFATLSMTYNDYPFCQASNDGNYFGAFIGVTSNLWSTLGPYINARLAGDHVAFHRVETFRLPMADGKARVRLRFMLAGSNSWDWGLDDLRIYSVAAIPSLQITAFSQSSTTVTVNWNGTGGNFSGLQKATSLNPANWFNVPGTIGQTNYTETIAGPAAYYRAVKF